MTAVRTESPRKAILTVVGRFTCSATHTGEWRGRAPSGRRFVDVERGRDEATTDRYGGRADG